MNTIFSLVQLLAFHFFISLIRAQSSNYPLVFSPYTLWSDFKSDELITYPVLSACPAESKDEIEMNSSKSIDKKALFVRQFYPKDVMVKDMIRCEKNYELAIVKVHKTNPMQVEFGFEITGDHEVDNPYLPIKKKLLNFMWIPRITLRFDNIFFTVMTVAYTIYRSADRINVQCTDYNLGADYFYEDTYHSYYTKENMKNILNEVEIPKESKCQSTENGCLEKYNLLMPHHFQSSPSSTASCSHFTSVPIWYEVSKQLLDYSERFLTAISEFLDRKLVVISGVYGTLSLPHKKRKNGEKLKWKEINLFDRYNKIPVPKIIFKIVRYQSHNCDSKTDLCWFDMVIVIHNQPMFTNEDILCLKDKCEAWGWENIQYMSRPTEDEKFSHIYCCKFDQKMSEKLKVTTDTYNNEDLNLKDFPVYNQKKGKNEYKNMQEEFLKQMDKLPPASVSQESMK